MRSPVNKPKSPRLTFALVGWREVREDNEKKKRKRWGLKDAILYCSDEKRRKQETPVLGTMI